MAAPAAAGGDAEEPEQEFDICNDEGFVYKVPSGLYPDAAPSSTQAAAGPDPEIVGLRRRRRALLRLRAKRLRQLSRWESLASELLAPHPDPRLPAPQSPPASPHPVAADATATATAASDSVLDDLIAQADVQAELLKKASQLCDEINALCEAREAAIVDDIVALPVWGDPRELLASFHSPDKQPDPGGLDGGFKSLDSQQGKRAIGVASAAVKSLKVSGDKRIQGPSECKRCFQFDCTRKTCCQAHDEQGNELPPPVLTENRKSKGVVSPSSSNGVAAQASNKSKRMHQGVNLLLQDRQQEGRLLPLQLQGLQTHLVVQDRQREGRLLPLQGLQTHLIVQGLQPGEGQQHRPYHHARHEHIGFCKHCVFRSLMYGVNVAIIVVQS
ncbi:unnamed protein product [Urochloa decumbens]|uniref:Uncharacterized protein n=1 Tax=Urochloa decumbens TaxID=240449 RepID=A0ABC8ZQG3_9POAL